MNVNLFINFYQDKNPARQRELMICVLANLYNPQIDSLQIFCSNADMKALIEMKETVDVSCEHKIKIHPFDGRPTFNDYFNLTQSFPNDINIISNKDIIMDEHSIEKLRDWDWQRYCLALSRWDFVDNNLDINKAVHYNFADSQDTWIAKGQFPDCSEANFGMGVAGCDNVIALILDRHYEVINPSLEIKSYHYHLTNVRNYTNIVGQAIERIPPPYKLVQPTMLP